LQSIPKYETEADPTLRQEDEELLKYVQATEHDLFSNASPQPAVEQPTLATILGSTASVRYSVGVHNDGSAAATISGIEFNLVRTQDLPPKTIDTDELLSLLKEIGDVSRIPAEPCPMPIPVGKTATVIEYEGKTSGNLQSIQTSCDDKALLQESENLGGLVREILNKLTI
jgi:hypothetical protein